VNQPGNALPLCRQNDGDPIGDRRGGGQDG
jgi:hypothetical protein